MYHMNNNALLKISSSVLIAAVSWFVIFVVKPTNFWLSMSCGILILVLTSFLFNHNVFKLNMIKLRHVGLGISSAIVLYGVFYIGNYLSAFIIPAKDALIDSVYMNKAGTSPYIILICLLFVIGPGEEFFWRGYIQETLSVKFGSKSIYMTAVLYAAVHIVTMNFMLIMASLVCGIFWGVLYNKEKSLYPVVISHTLWDIIVFLLLPLN